MRKTLLTAMCSGYQGDIDRAKANIEVYLTNPAGIGEHPDIVEAIEGPLSLTDCTPSPSGCAWAMDCPASSVWVEVQESMKDTLRRSTLEDLVSMPRRNGRVSNAPPVE